MSTSARSIAVLDIGKTNARLIVVDSVGGDERYRVERATSSIDGRVTRELDVRAIEAWLLESLAGVPGKEHIEAIVPVAHGAAAVLVDEGGEVVAAPDYEDPIFDSVAEEYRALRDPFERTYSPSLPLGLNLGRQLYFMERTAPQLFAVTRQVVLYPQYWAARLSGSYASEVTSLGCHSDLWCPLEARYSSLAESRGWTRLLPPLAHAGAVLGTITPALADCTGLDPACHVLCGLHDSNASYLGHLASRDQTRPLTVISSGTWTVIMCRGTPLSRLCERDDTLANVDVFGTPVATARFMGGREYEAIAGREALNTPPSVAALEFVVARQAMALPCFADAGGPFAGSRGRFVDAENLDVAQRAALATLYVALMVDYTLERLGACPDVLVDGPLAENPLFARVLRALRPNAWITPCAASHGASSAARYLVTGRTPAMQSLPGARMFEDRRLERYRAAWRAQLERLDRRCAA